MMHVIFSDPITHMLAGFNVAAGLFEGLPVWWRWGCFIVGALVIAFDVIPAALT